MVINIQKVSVFAILFLSCVLCGDIVGPYQADSYTLHLWHLDETSLPLYNSVSGGPNLNYMGPGSTVNQSSYTDFGKAYQGMIRGESGVSDGSWLAPYQAVNGTGDNTTMSYAGANGAFTYEAIIRIDFNPAGLPGAMEIIGADEDSGSRLFQFGINGSGLFFTALTPSIQMIAAAIPSTGENAIVQGNWYHVAAVYNGQAGLQNNLKLYWTLLSPDRMEANCIGSGSLASDLTTGKTPDFVIGNEGRDGNKRSEGFIGMIDEVRISSAARQPYQMMFRHSTPPARLMEKLDRGLVAVKVSAGVYVGWRMLGTDLQNIAFNVYRDGIKVTSSPITNSTNLLDSGGTTGSVYYVRPVIGGIEQPASEIAGVWANYWQDIPLQIPAGVTTPDDYICSYSPGDCSVGDLDGDGKNEIVLKWDPSNARDNASSGYSGNVYLDAYELDGTRLWRIDLGINIRAGAHYTQFMVYDLDSDGKAEMVCKTADGTTDGAGTVIGNASSDYRNSSGYILSGPEFLTVFNGQTGAAMATTNYVPARGTVSDWGDSYGNRVDRFLACVAYLDGRRPSVVMCRGYYTKTYLAAWDWRDGQLMLRWLFSSTDPGNGAYAGQGNHNLSVGDVDGDGRDEIVYGSCTIDDDGTGLYSTGLGHGDAMHLSDMDPSRPGLEVWQCHESGNGSTFRDAANGQIIFQHLNSGDVGRCLASHIDSRYIGYQLWSYAAGGTYTTTNVQFSTGQSSQSFVVWWDADLQRELLDAADGNGKNAILDKWNGSDNVRLLSLYNVPASYSSQTINGTKSTPCLSGDLLGDWREEIILRSSDYTKLRIFTPTTVVSNRIYTLLHDPQYRLAIAWQNVGYNQPPHPSFYIGAEMSTPPVSNIEPVEDTTRGLLREWWLGISGGTVSDLTSNANYPYNPTGMGRLDSLEEPSNWTENYGSRIRGYLCPTQTGAYTFWIAADDSAQLWLSTDAAPQNAAMVASVSSWTGQREWSKYPQQQSVLISLEAGHKYYIEVLHKEGTYDDHLAVAWQGTGIAQQVIDGAYLRPWVDLKMGDINLDKRVDLGDFKELAIHWLRTDCTFNLSLDMTGDCDINLYDLLALSQNWLQSPPEPLSYWPMNETSGLLVPDSAGGHDGQMINMSGSAWGAGIKGNALDFDGVNDYVQITGYKGILGTSSRTCAAWVKTPGSSSNMVIADWGAPAAGQKWLFGFFSTGELTVYLQGPYIKTNAIFTDNQWHYVAAVLSSDGTPEVSDIKLYVDGQMQAATVVSNQAVNTIAGNDAALGAILNSGTPTGVFKGLIDDVRIYDVALNNSQIAELTKY